MSIKLGMISLGCAKNLVDGEHMLAQLADAGVTIVDDVAEADVAVVNTCGFIESAKQEAINTILETAQLKQTGSLKALIVTGCLVQRYPKEIVEELPEIDAVLGTGSYTNIVDAVRAVMQAPGTVPENRGGLRQSLCVLRNSVAARQVPLPRDGGRAQGGTGAGGCRCARADYCRTGHHALRHGLVS